MSVCPVLEFAPIVTGEMCKHYYTSIIIQTVRLITIDVVRVCIVKNRGKNILLKYEKEQTKSMRLTSLAVVTPDL